MRGWWMAFGFLLMPLFALGQAYIDTVEAYAVFKACYRYTEFEGRPLYVISVGNALSLQYSGLHPSADSCQGQILKEGQIPYDSGFAIHWNKRKLRRYRFASEEAAYAMSKMAEMLFLTQFSKPVNTDSMKTWKAISGIRRRVGTVIDIRCPVFTSPNACIVEVSYHCGPLCASWSTLHMRKVGKRWRIAYKSREASA